ncbi:MAG TPA: hypothetical protein VNZ52_11110, partial [Candidatus Thermoplasmatota archaeon]|nr:hypothetical protein [Candidatus Thermoplasmatota archaeon]
MVARRTPLQLALGALLALSLLPPLAAAGTLSDGFGGSSLGGHWDVVDSDPAGLSVADGNLVLSALKGSPYGYPNYPKNVVVYEKSFGGDFEASASVTFTASSGYPDQPHGGLVLWSSHDTWALLRLNYNGEGGYYATFDAHPSPQDERPYESFTVEASSTLRLTRSDGMLTASVESNGETSTFAAMPWTSAGHVGFMAYNSGYEYRTEQSTTVPAPASTLTVHSATLRAPEVPEPTPTPPPPADTEKPKIESYGPEGDREFSPYGPIIASFSDNKGVIPSKSVFLIDGKTPQGRLHFSDTFLEFFPEPPFFPGNHTVTLILADAAENLRRVTWTFRAAPVEAHHDPHGNTTEGNHTAPEDGNVTPTEDPADLESAGADGSGTSTGDGSASPD